MSDVTRLIDAAAARVATLRGHAMLMKHVASSRDGRRLYSLSTDSAFRTWGVGPSAR